MSSPVASVKHTKELGCVVMFDETPFDVDTLLKQNGFVYSSDLDVHVIADTEGISPTVEQWQRMQRVATALTTAGYEVPKPTFETGPQQPFADGWHREHQRLERRVEGRTELAERRTNEADKRAEAIQSQWEWAALTQPAGRNSALGRRRARDNKSSKVNDRKYSVAAYHLEDAKTAQRKLDQMDDPRRIVNRIRSVGREIRKLRRTDLDTGAEGTLTTLHIERLLDEMVFHNNRLVDLAPDDVLDLSKYETASTERTVPEFIPGTAIEVGQTVWMRIEDSARDYGRWPLEAGIVLAIRDDGTEQTATIENDWGDTFERSCTTGASDELHPIDAVNGRYLLKRGRQPYGMARDADVDFHERHPELPTFPFELRPRFASPFKPGEIVTVLTYRGSELRYVTEATPDLDQWIITTVNKAGELKTNHCRSRANDDYVSSLDESVKNTLSNPNFDAAWAERIYVQASDLKAQYGPDQAIQNDFANGALFTL